MLFVGGPLHGRVMGHDGRPMRVEPQDPVKMEVIRDERFANSVLLRATSKFALYLAQTVEICEVEMLVMAAADIATHGPKVVDALRVAAGLGRDDG